MRLTKLSPNESKPSQQRNEQGSVMDAIACRGSAWFRLSCTGTSQTQPRLERHDYIQAESAKGLPNRTSPLAEAHRRQAEPPPPAGGAAGAAPIDGRVDLTLRVKLHDISSY